MSLEDTSEGMLMLLADQLRSQSFDASLKKPFQVRQVVESIEKLTSIIH